VGSEASFEGVSCPVCGEGLPGAPVACPRCETPHHAECWEFAEGCAIYGCKENLCLARRVSEGRLARSGPVPGSGLARWAVLPFLWVRNLDAMTVRQTGAWVFFLGLAGGMAACNASRYADFGWATSGVMVLGLLLASAHRALPYLAGVAVKSLHRPALLAETPVEELEARLEEDPKNVALIDQVAHACFANGEPDRSRRLYERGLSIQPEHLRFRYRLGRCWQQLGQDDRAIEAYRAVAAVEPDSELGRRAAWWLDKLG